MITSLVKFWGSSLASPKISEKRSVSWLTGYSPNSKRYAIFSNPYSSFEIERINV